MKRRLILAFPFSVAGCSVLPDRPFIESRRFVLDPRREGPSAERPRHAGPHASRHAILLRSMRAAPGLEQRGLRRLRADGRLEVAPYEEWMAPPAELAEQALRQWLVASGQFSAVTAPGSRLETALILETELLALEIGPEGARAAMAVLLLIRASGLGEPRPIGQTRLESVIAVPSSAEGGAPAVAIRAVAMQEALGRVLSGLESWIVSRV